MFFIHRRTFGFFGRIFRFFKFWDAGTFYTKQLVSANKQGLETYDCLFIALFLLTISNK